MVAVGAADCGDGDDDFIEKAAIWISADGLTWTQAPHDYLRSNIDADRPIGSRPTTDAAAIVAIGYTIWIVSRDD